MKTTPYHLGIILDGNRRWAKEKGLPAFEGHRQGAETVKKTIEWCKNKGVKILTLFAFSTENWKRSKTEVGFLMKMLQNALNQKNIRQISEKGIKIQVIGQKEKLPSSLQETIKSAEDFTTKNKEMTLNFALSYGGRAEITEAIKKIIEKRIPVSRIDEKVIGDNLWTSDVDLVIRTGKEERISNFLIWQAAYSELYFCKKYWPEFSEKDLEEAFFEYNQRQRRFGK